MGPAPGCDDSTNQPMAPVSQKGCNGGENPADSVNRKNKREYDEEEEHTSAPWPTTWPTDPVRTHLRLRRGRK